MIIEAFFLLLKPEYFGAFPRNWNDFPAIVWFYASVDENWWQFWTAQNWIWPQAGRNIRHSRSTAHCHHNSISSTRGNPQSDDWLEKQTPKKGRFTFKIEDRKQKTISLGLRTMKDILLNPENSVLNPNPNGSTQLLWASQSNDYLTKGNIRLFCGTVESLFFSYNPCLEIRHFSVLFVVRVLSSNVGQSKRIAPDPITILKLNLFGLVVP